MILKKNSDINSGMIVQEDMINRSASLKQNIQDDDDEQDNQTGRVDKRKLYRRPDDLRYINFNYDEIIRSDDRGLNSLWKSKSGGLYCQLVSFSLLSVYTLWNGFLPLP